MIQITDPSKCCGCTACSSICPHDAISMIPDNLGFLYPAVDTTKCNSCGLCEKTCAFHDDYDKSNNLDQPDVYGVRHKNLEEVLMSRSGAAFVALSDMVLNNGGIIYGAGYKDHFTVCHKKASTMSERDEFRGSKYVQSDLTGVFREIREGLRNGQTILFSGTPCQTSGLSSFIGKKLRENLILIDIVCHGVPGPFIWHDYLNYLEEKHGGRIAEVNFRDKRRYGWKAHKESMLTEDGTVLTDNLFSKLFKLAIMFRHSCSNCHFCNTTRPSDITLADFWGWQKQNVDINDDDKGLSLVFVNTKKGQDLFQLAKSELCVFEAKPEAYMQPNLRHASKINSKRAQFEKDYVRYGFNYIAEHIGKYQELSVIKRTKRIIRKLRNKIQKER